MIEPATARNGTIPEPLEPDGSQLASTLQEASHLLCCLDYDGTLAPIVDDPSAATIPPETERVLDRLQASPAVTVAIVSGRSVLDLRTRIRRPVTLFGNHGLERLEPAAADGSGPTDRGDDGRSSAPLGGGPPSADGGPTEGVSVHPLAAAAISRIEACCGSLDVALASVPNASVEHKRLTGTVHYRTVPEPAVPLCRRLATGIVARIGGSRLSVSDGDQIVEFGPAIEWGKGDAVDLLRAEHPPGTAVLAFGDDTTDEDAFRALSGDDVGIRVGGPHPSAGHYRTDSPTTLVPILEWLATEGAAMVEQRSDAGTELSRRPRDR